MASQDKVVFITGANKGIGLETARGLGELGIAVVIGSRDGGKGRVAADKLRAEGEGRGRPVRRDQARGPPRGIGGASGSDRFRGIGVRGIAGHRGQTDLRGASGSDRFRGIGVTGHRGPGASGSDRFRIFLLNETRHDDSMG